MPDPRMQKTNRGAIHASVRTKSHRMLLAPVVALTSVIALTSCGGGTGGGEDLKSREPVVASSPSAAPEATSSDPDAFSSASDPFTYGDDHSLDALWDACAGGDRGACVDLFFDSPFDSEYETFGATCGGQEDYGACASYDDDASGQTDDSPSVTGWVASAEEACRSIYQTRGTAPFAASKDVSDDMMLYYDWLSDLLRSTVDALSPIGGSTPESNALIQDISYLSGLYNEAAAIYNDHPIISQRLNEIDAESPQVEAALRSRADALGVPTCGEIAIGNSEGWG